DTVLVMLTSVAQKGDANLFKKVGFSAYLTKPVRAVELVETLAAVWGAKIKGKPLALVTRFSLAESRTLRASWHNEVESEKTRVLVAEDNVVNQKIAAKMLKKLGCRVDIAGNGVEAVEMTELCPYHLVFMDCQMPEMDGFEATAEIRSREKNGEHIPIVAITSYTVAEAQERCLSIGMDDFIHKPISKKVLHQRLERWVDSYMSEPVQQS
ncbi:response regulator, partial [bacterium]|nr:response regulator [bacterium]